MNPVVMLVFTYARRKLLEPSTWAGIVTAVGTSLHFSVSPDLQNAIDMACVSIVSLLLVAVNERRKLPAGTVPVVTPCPTCGLQGQPPDAAVVATDTGSGLQTVSRPDVRPTDDPGPKPHRPGFGPY